MNVALKAANRATVDFFVKVCTELDTAALITKAWSETESRILDQLFEVGETCEEVQETLAELLETVSRFRSATVNYREVAQALLVRAGKWTVRPVGSLVS
jgi:hypothetical protein